LAVVNYHYLISDAAVQSSADHVYL